MATNVTMPKLGLTMETGKIIEWKKQEGEQVQEKEILLVVETEKITYEVEAPATGILHIISPVESEVPVAELIGIIAADKAEFDTVAAAGAPAPAASAAPVAQEAAAPAAPAAQAPAAPARAPGERIKASPLAKKLAQEKDLDISLITGTGPEGRITRKDVLAFELSAPRVKISPVAKKMADEMGIDPGTIKGSGPGGRITKEDVERHAAAAKAPCRSGTGRSSRSGTVPKVTVWLNLPACGRSSDRRCSRARPRQPRPTWQTTAMPRQSRTSGNSCLPMQRKNTVSVSPSPTS